MVKYYYNKYNAVATYSLSDSLVGSKSNVGYGDEFADVFYSITSKAKFYMSTAGYYTTTFDSTSGTINYHPANRFTEQLQSIIVGVMNHNVDTAYFAYSAYGEPTKHYKATIVQSSNYTVTIYERTLNATYSRGTTLVQSNLVAENGTYPTNGRHTDGYWYVRGAMYNSAPSTPNPFTAPTGIQEIGDSKVISWGASTDAENNIAHYEVEYSLDGSGTWTKIGNTSSLSMNFTIPTATSIQFRVKAVDSGGLSSGYRTSSALTVRKPYYYWNRYNVNTIVLEYKEPVNWYNDGGGFVTFSQLYMGYTFDKTTNKFSTAGHTQWSGHVPQSSYGYIASQETGVLYRYETLEGGVATKSHPTNRFTKFLSESEKVETYQRGSLVTTVQAEQTAYTNNTRNSDGYWYVLGSRVAESIAPPKLFTQPSSGTLLKYTDTNIQVSFGSSDANPALYEVDYTYDGVTWTAMEYTNATTRTLSSLSQDRTKTSIYFRVRAKSSGGVYSDYIYSEVYTIRHNSDPSLSVPSLNGRVVYNSEDVIINGYASDRDVDEGDILTVKYKVNDGEYTVLESGVALEQGNPFTLTLTNTDGNLFVGEEQVSTFVSDGNQTVTFLVEDDKGGTSEEGVVTFFVTDKNKPTIDVLFTGENNNVIQLSVEDSSNITTSVKMLLNGEKKKEVLSDFGTILPIVIEPNSLIPYNNNEIVITLTDNLGTSITKTYNVSLYLPLTPFIPDTHNFSINGALSIVGEIESENFVEMTQKVVGLSLTTAEVQLIGSNARNSKTSQRITMKRSSADINYNVNLYTGAID